MSGHRAWTARQGHHGIPGQLVPDDTIVEMIDRRIVQPDSSDWVSFSTAFRAMCHRRRRSTRCWPKHNLKLDHVILLDVDEAALVDRLSGRFTCTQCGASFHDRYNRPFTRGCL